MRILKNLAIFCLFAISSNVFAGESVSVPKENDYYANYYKDTETSLLFKIRGFYAATNAKSRPVLRACCNGIADLKR